MEGIVACPYRFRACHQLCPGNRDRLDMLMPEGACRSMTGQSATIHIKEDQAMKRQRLEVPSVSMFGARMHLMSLFRVVDALSVNCVENQAVIFRMLFILDNKNCLEDLNSEPGPRGHCNDIS